MTAHTRNKPIPLSGHLLRTATLLEYASNQIGQSQLLLNTIALNYPSLCSRWLEWAIALASLRHQMEGQSQLLSSMATRASKDTGATLLTSREALVKYSELREVRNES